MRRIFSILAGLVLSLGFSGCLWEFAPSAPSRSDNTWLLGVWEGDGVKEGTTYRVVVAPTESDRMQVVYSEKNKAGKVVKSGTAAAWISRVGQVSLLVVELSPGPSDPSYLLLGYQILSPLSIRVREVTLDPPEPPANPFRLRVAIRKAFSEGTLFGGGDAIWRRTGEVYWPENPDPATDTFTPPRVPLAAPLEELTEASQP